MTNPDDLNSVCMKDIITKKVRIDTTEIDVAIKKARRLRKLLIKANSLANELASKDLLKIDIQL